MLGNPAMPAVRLVLDVGLILAFGYEAEASLQAVTFSMSLGSPHTTYPVCLWVSLPVAVYSQIEIA